MGSWNSLAKREGIREGCLRAALWGNGLRQIGTVVESHVSKSERWGTGPT
jgi:hypothetical protein